MIKLRLVISEKLGFLLFHEISRNYQLLNFEKKNTAAIQLYKKTVCIETK